MTSGNIVTDSSPSVRMKALVTKTNAQGLFLDGTNNATDINNVDFNLGNFWFYGIFKVTSLQAQATETTSDVKELTEDVEKIEDQVQELQNKMTRSEIQLETAVDDISEVKGDTRAILNLLQRQPTRD